MRRRLLFTEERVRAIFARLRDEMHEQHFRHLCEMADLRKELDQARDEFEQLRDAVLKRQAAEAEVAMLKRTRAIVEGEMVSLH
jgi:hypothetical protein